MGIYILIGTKNFVYCCKNSPHRKDLAWEEAGALREESLSQGDLKKIQNINNQIFLYFTARCECFNFTAQYEKTQPVSLAILKIVD